MYANGDAPAVPETVLEAARTPLGDWADKMYLGDARRMTALPDAGIALAFTSPPYNVGKQYDDDLTFVDYRQLLRDVAGEVYRVLVPGGRYVINV
ncbi:MAG: site-specific DNA-methyltransferase, partial [Caldilineaceae bacterium]|nr:site-specific DNA-methyltransferase [Caldilineaceae bacterium]